MPIAACISCHPLVVSQHQISACVQRKAELKLTHHSCLHLALLAWNLEHGPARAACAQPDDAAWASTLVSMHVLVLPHMSRLQVVMGCCHTGKLAFSLATLAFSILCQVPASSAVEECEFHRLMLSSPAACSDKL